MSTLRSPEEATRRWLETFVVGMNLCPFAAKPWNRGQIRIEVSNASNNDERVHALLSELETLVTAEPDHIATTLLVFPHGLGTFDSYLDFVETAQDLLEQSGLEGLIQLASFHPDYLFEGEAPDATSHYTNRSPYPMLHLIREDEMEAALANYPAPELIPERNMEIMKELGLEKIRALLNQCMDSSDDQ